MKKKINILVLFLITQLCFSQIGTRELIRGQVVNDSVNVENVVVFNVNSKTGTVTGKQGFFKINVKENDTLVFSGLQFKSKKVVYSEIKRILKVNLEVFFYQLSEVVISGKDMVKPIQGSQEIVDQKYFGDEKSTPKNVTMNQVGGFENQMDFVRIYKDLVKLINKDSTNKSKLVMQTDFTEMTMLKIPYSFFNNTLKLADDEIKLFLVFCENDPKVTAIQKTNSDFEIMNFLIEKNIEFKKIANFEE